MRILVLKVMYHAFQIHPITLNAILTPDFLYLYMNYRDYACMVCGGIPFL